MVTVNQIRQTVQRVAPRYGIRGVTLFGSYARGDQQQDSDIDLLVEYAENPVSLFTMYGFKEDVQAALGTDVDILKYPLENLIYPEFELGETVNVYAVP